MKKYKQSTHIELIEFVRPTRDYWPSPYSIEMAFSVMQWMIASGEGFKTPQQWVTPSVGGDLGGYNADNAHPRPVTSIADLKQRFHIALLKKGEGYSKHLTAWRSAHKIHLDSSLDLDFAHYKPLTGALPGNLTGEDDIRTKLTQLLEHSDGKTTSEQLNEYHPTARVVHGVDITIRANNKRSKKRGDTDFRFEFCLHYGFVSRKEMLGGKPDSEWHHTLASSVVGESFLDTFVRALQEFDWVMNGGRAVEVADGCAVEFLTD